MKKVFYIARASIIELAREKFFLLAFFLGVLFVGFSLILGQLSSSEYNRITGDFGFTAVEITTVGLSIFLGSVLIGKEVERQTCLLILARPVSRFVFILGKLFSLVALTTFMIFTLMALIWILIVLPGAFINYLYIALSIWLKTNVVLAFVLAMSLVVRPVLASFAGLALYLFGHWIPDLKFFAEKSKDEFFIQTIKVFDWCVPNFYAFNWKSFVFLEETISPYQVIWAVGHSICWWALFLFFINYQFGRKDIV